MQDKIRKLKAIKKLAEAGAPGEKEAAQHKLKTLCEKWGVSLEMLEETKVQKNYAPAGTYYKSGEDMLREHADMLRRQAEMQQGYLRQHMAAQRAYMMEMAQAQASYSYVQPSGPVYQEEPKKKWWEKIFD